MSEHNQSQIQDFISRARSAQEAVDNLIRCVGKHCADHRPISITCPVCGMTSYNVNDVREGYCGNCHTYTTTTP
jgi:protein-arginine kinase activator protein McsA